MGSVAALIAIKSYEGLVGGVTILHAAADLLLTGFL